MRCSTYSVLPKDCTQLQYEIHGAKDFMGTGEVAQLKVPTTEIYVTAELGKGGQISKAHHPTSSAKC